jgi:hypothetical protein
MTPAPAPEKGDRMLLRNAAAMAAALALSLLAVPTPAAASPAHRRGVNAREHRQAVRIRNGVKQDEITKGEGDRLKADQAAVRAEEKVYRRSGDRLTARERKDLEKDLHRTSKEIYRAKHNDRTPPSPAPHP